MLFALVIAMVIKTFMIQAFVIPSGSMQNTLAINDKILVNKLVYDFRAIKPGDIVVFNGVGSWNAQPPSGSNSNLLARLFDDTVRRAVDSVGGLFGTPVGQTDYVKRVIGVPGDRVFCCTTQGLLTVNGVPLHEQSYLYPGDQSGSAPGGIPGHFSVTVPPGYLWVLGDHRGVSDDSRGHRTDPGNGMIPESKVIGRAFVIVWPPSRLRILPIPATFDQPGVDGAGAARRSSAGWPQRPAIAPSVSSGQPMAAVRPAAPYLPTAAGVVGAVPLTWLKRRARLWIRARTGRKRGKFAYFDHWGTERFLLVWRGRQPRSRGDRLGGNDERRAQHPRPGDRFGWATGSDQRDGSRSGLVWLPRHCRGPGCQRKPLGDRRYVGRPGSGW